MRVAALFRVFRGSVFMAKKRSTNYTKLHEEAAFDF